MGANRYPWFRICAVTARWQVAVEYVHRVATYSYLHMHIEVHNCGLHRVATYSYLHMHIEVHNCGLQDDQRLRHQCCDSSTLSSLAHTVHCYVGNWYN